MKLPNVDFLMQLIVSFTVNAVTAAIVVDVCLLQAIAQLSGTFVWSSNRNAKTSSPKLAVAIAVCGSPV
jgi:hypothetical protein